MAMTAGINCTTRTQRAIEQSPIPEMTADLIAGHITPVTGIKELQMRYRQSRLNEPDAKSCMTHACRAYAQLVGAVLVATDQEATIVFGAVNDPGLDPDDPEMIPALRALGKTLDPATDCQYHRIAFDVGSPENSRVPDLRDAGFCVSNASMPRWSKPMAPTSQVSAFLSRRQNCADPPSEEKVGQAHSQPSPCQTGTMPAPAWCSYHRPSFA